MRYLISQCLSPACSPAWLEMVRYENIQVNPAPVRPAAVLLPIVERPEGMTIILTQRTAHLHNHPGQICLPGGRTDPEDENPPIGTALRETEEEIGLSRERIEVVGYLEAFETVTGFSIATVVGFVKPGFVLKPDTFEVAEVFEVPLSFILNPAHHERQSVFYQGKERFYYVIRYQDRMIWGATAGILVNFYQCLQPCL